MVPVSREMKKSKWEFIVKIDGGWQEVKRERTTHYTTATVLKADSTHAKFAPSSKIVLRTHTDHWPDGLPEVSERTALIAHTLDRPTVGPDGWRPSFVLVPVKGVNTGSKGRRLVVDAFKKI